MPKDVSTGRIFRQTVSGVTYGIIDPSDVGPIIGSTSTDVGTLCTYSAINPDALFKPYKHTNPGNPSFYTGGADGMYGFTIPNTQNDIKTVSFWGNDAKWSFNSPDTWYNLQEFDGYNHNVRFANHPWGLELIETSSSLMCSFNWDGPSSYGSEFVCPKSMNIFQDYYMAVAILVGSGTTWTFRYAKSHNEKISAANGCLLTIDKTEYDHTLPTTGNSLVLIPFLASANFAANGTTNENSLSGVRKFNINYKSGQFAYIDGTAPQHGTFTFTPLSISRPNSYQVYLTVRVKNETASTQSGAFYVLYKFYEINVAPYKDLLLDCSIYEAGRNPSQSFSLAAGASADYTLELGGIDGGSHGFDATDIDVIDVKIYSPSNSGDSTNYKEMSF